MNEKTLEELTKTLSEKYPFGIPRKDIAKATGGILHPRTSANLDSLGTGIEGRFRINRSIIYPVGNVINFIRERTIGKQALINDNTNT